ncbi:MAG TPA: diacylglycerol kinase family protein [Candidatus Synoicihabitans sp.]|nr:diacylglycerol kinase family protein [Candidatus Synoicihabitans sp.]
MSTVSAPARTRLRFIFNPRSGHNARDPYLLDRARAFIAEHELDATVVLTEYARHATDLARAAVLDGCNVVVAIGGDGTMNEVAAGLVATSATLGLIPCGSGNGLGRHLGVPNPGRGAFRTLLHGRIREIDTGFVNAQPFFNVMGVGFDAEISARFNRSVHRGLPAYVRTVMTAWSSYHRLRCTIRDDRGALVTDAFLIAIANSDQYGNNCYIAPGARVDDGRLDLTILQRVDWLNAAPLAARLFLNCIGGSTSVVRRQSRAFTIERAAPGPIHTDGEVHEMAARLEVSVRPRSLRVLVPALS